MKIDQRFELIEAEVRELRKHIGKIYDRIYSLSKELGQNAVEDAKVQTTVKMSLGQKVKKGSIWTTLATFIGSILYYLFNQL